ncbi:MAG: hypothetical protein IID28_11410 [Planctomycetes bacterium]|nr:hypothetical protein [Planctomycetota bacterium]
MTQMPPPVAPPPDMPMQPHRGVMILVFSILSWFLCVIFGIVAWVLANSDLRAMAEGRMDPTGEGITKAGKIVAMISVILNLLAIPVIIILIVLGAFAAAAASSGGAAP